MSKVVFILGAGASADCGAPVMKDFLDTARDLLASGKVDGEDKEHFERVFKAISSLQRVHSKAQLDLYNIESVFTALEFANTLGKLPDFEAEEIPQIKEEPPQIIDSLKRLIVVTLEKSVKFRIQQNNRKNGDGYVLPEGPYGERSYGEFSKLLKSIQPSRTVSVMTFNYDIALDVAMYHVEKHSEQIKTEYCLSGNVADDSVKLLKLHGSLNWAKGKSKGKSVVCTVMMKEIVGPSL